MNKNYSLAESLFFKVSPAPLMALLTTKISTLLDLVSPIMNENCSLPAALCEIPKPLDKSK